MPATKILLFAVALLTSADQAKFETASVKKAEPCAYDQTLSPATVVLKGMPLTPVLITAFAMPRERIEGPSWLDSDCFDIFARIPEGVGQDQLPAMLQALLAERFGMVTHKETRTRQVYALVVDKGGPKVKEDDPSTNFMGPGRAGQVMFGYGGTGKYKQVATMAGLAGYLSKRGYGPVVDSTGLTAKYDIDLSWAPNPEVELQPRPGQPVPEVANAPTADLFTALREQLGLRMEARKEPLEYLVIDHIERVPAGN